MRTYVCDVERAIMFVAVRKAALPKTAHIGQNQSALSLLNIGDTKLNTILLMNFQIDYEI